MKEIKTEFQKVVIGTVSGPLLKKRSKCFLKGIH